MELKEIVVEGLKGFPQMTRVSLGSGLTVVHPVDDRGQVLRAVLLDLLYPQGTEPTLVELVDPAAQASRVGLLIVGRDGTPFRILKDIRGGKITLLRQGEGGMQPVSSTAAEIAQAITAQVGFPQRDVFEDVFLSSKPDMPSQRPDALEVSNPNLQAPPAVSGEGAPEDSGLRSAWNKPLPPGFAEAMQDASGEFSALSEQEKWAKLEELRGQLAQIDEIRELEFELDGVQKKSFAIDEQLRPLDNLRKQLAEAEALLEQNARGGELPADLPQQKNEHLRFKAELDEEVATLDEKRKAIGEQLKAELARVEGGKGFGRAVVSDPLILVGTLGGVAALLVGVVGMFTMPALRYVALADVVAFGAALVGALRFIKDAEQAAVLRGQLDKLERDRQKAVDRFEIETSHFRALLKRNDLTLDDVEGLEEVVHRYGQAKHARDAAQAALQEALGGETLDSVLQERNDVQAEIKRLEEKLYATGGFMGNKADLEAQVKELEVLLGVDDGGEPPSAPAPSSSGTMPAAGGLGETAKAVQRLVHHAADLFMTDLSSTCDALGPRAGQYLSGMSDRRYGQMIFGPQGEVSVVDAASGRAIPFGMLTPGDRDITFLCLKMTIIELAVRNGRLPVILDRAFETFPELKHGLIVRMLQFLAQGTQVLVLTKAASVAAAGGQQVALPPSA